MLLTLFLVSLMIVYGFSRTRGWKDSFDLRKARHSNVINASGVIIRQLDRAIGSLERAQRESSLSGQNNQCLALKRYLAILYLERDRTVTVRVGGADTFPDFMNMWYQQSRVASALEHLCNDITLQVRQKQRLTTAQIDLMEILLGQLDASGSVLR